MNVLADTVKVTLRPKGCNVLIERRFGAPTITKDGVSVAKEIELKDRFENTGAHGTVYLPRSTEEVTEVELPHAQRIAGGSETIVVVEDDRRVQSTVIEMLTQLGYTVLKADDAPRVPWLFSDVA